MLHLNPKKKPFRTSERLVIW